MAFMFQRKLALPVWAMVFCALAVMAPPPTTLLLMVLGTALMATTITGLAPRLSGVSTRSASSPMGGQRQMRSASMPG